MDQCAKSDHGALLAFKSKLQVVFHQLESLICISISNLAIVRSLIARKSRAANEILKRNVVRHSCPSQYSNFKNSSNTNVTVVPIRTIDEERPHLLTSVAKLMRTTIADVDDN